MPFEVLYLTGPPAVGKTSVLRALRSRRSDVAAFSYGEHLTRLASDRLGSEFVQDEIRSKSAAVIRPEDVLRADRDLLDFVSTQRTSCHVIIDSHPVTKEMWGFRCTAFSARDLAALAPSRIVCLYAEGEVLRERIERDPEGRPEVDRFHATMHTFLQASVAAAYGVLVGCPVYYIDAAVGLDGVVEQVERLLG